MSNMTHAEIRNAAELLNAVQRSDKLRWISDNGEIVTGTLRYITDFDGAAGYGDPTRDVRTQWIRVTTSWENWFKFSDVLEWIDKGNAAIGG